MVEIYDIFIVIIIMRKSRPKLKDYNRMKGVKCYSQVRLHVYIAIVYIVCIQI